MESDKIDAVNALVVRQQKVINDYKQICVKANQFIKNESKPNLGINNSSTKTSLINFDVTKLPIFLKQEIDKLDANSDSYVVLKLINNQFSAQLNRCDMGYFIDLNNLYGGDNYWRSLDKVTISKLTHNPNKFGYLQTYEIKGMGDVMHVIEFKPITKNDVLENTRSLEHYLVKKNSKRMDKTIKEFQNYQNQQKYRLVDIFQEYFNQFDISYVQKAFKKLGIAVY